MEIIETVATWPQAAADWGITRKECAICDGPIEDGEEVVVLSDYFRTLAVAMHRRCA